MFKYIIYVLLLFVYLLNDVVSKDVQLKFPLIFQADVEIESHLLDKSIHYPSRFRKMKIYYNYPLKRAKAEIIYGFEKGKTFIRHYDKKNEYMIKEGDYPTCERAFLGEEMPYPAFPSDMKYLNNEKVGFFYCEHWVLREDLREIHVYQTIDHKIPIKLQDVMITEKKTSFPVLTYTFDQMEIGIHNDSNFHLPKNYTHGTCSRKYGGFPYIHAFHDFLRF